MDNSLDFSKIKSASVEFTVQISVSPSRTIGSSADPPIDDISIVTFAAPPLSASVTVTLSVVILVPGALDLPLSLSIVSGLVEVSAT